MWFLFTALGAVVLLICVLVIRAFSFRPKAQPCAQAEPLSFDREGPISALQQLIRCRTVSNADPALEDPAEFKKLIGLMPQLYPRVFDVCSFQRFPDRGLLLRWPGKRCDAPSVMMAHYDVVDVEEGQWSKPPFDGLIEDGCLWGRGTLDTKATFNGILCAAERLILEGFVPENDVYFAFSGSEEINGNGAKHIVDYFRFHEIHPALVLDEGGAVVENVFPGVTSPCALIGIGEKGMMNVEYRVSAQGGHASAPPVHSSVDRLASACLRVRKHPFKMRISTAAAQLFDTLGRHSDFGYQLIFANLWLFRPVLDLICRKTGGELDALVRTTTAFTQMQGSNGRNVLPATASMISNMRLNPGDTLEAAEAHLRRAVADQRVELRVLEGFEASRVSETDCDAYRKLSGVITQTWPGCIVSPYLMVQCSDARHYSALSDRVYRFCPMELTAEERKTIHGNDERIRLDAICKTVEFYIRLLKQC